LLNQIAQTIEGINGEEKDRNRHRVLEINSFFREVKNDLDILNEIAHN